MNRVITSKEQRELQQPLDNKTGYSNDNFDKLYPKSKNPFHGTERDSKNKKNYPIGHNWGVGDSCDMCSNRAEFKSVRDGQLEWKLCKECYHKKNE